jgi:thiol:disulfide interchange protein DsbD
MGLGAGVIAAPCTGPVLAAVLVFVAAHRSALLGFWLLFTYALGMGTLFFLLGATSLKLPRSGPWMETVKSVLGVTLVIVSASLVLPLLPKAPELAARPAALAAGAGVTAFVAIFAGALSLSFHGGRGEARLKVVSLAGLVAAVGLQLGWFGAVKRPGIRWLHDESAALAQAAASGKRLLVDFRADWCTACRELEEHTFSDPEVQRQIEDRFVPLQVDATNTTLEVEKLTAKYDVPGFPTVLLMACNDAPAAAPQCEIPDSGPGRLIGFEPAQRLLDRMRLIP